MYNKLRDERYMPEKKGKQNKGLLKRSDSSSDEEDHKKSKWAQYLPIIKSTDKPLAHLHQKTYFNQTQILANDDKKFNQIVRAEVKPIATMVNKVRDIIRRRKKYGRGKTTLTRYDSDEEDPNVDIVGFKKATKELLLESGYVRRPGVQIRSHNWEAAMDYRCTQL